MTPEQVAEIKAQIENAHNEVGAICLEGAASRWRMSIPARQDRDSDLIISAALESGAALIAEVERLTTPPVGTNGDHTARLRQVFAKTITEMSGASPEALAAQLALYANAAIWAAEREALRALELARIVVEGGEAG